jgi:metal-sulfur cluster biosynthetic enzyme
VSGLREGVLAALATVRDPELDEPLTELGFVSRVELDGARVRVGLRLPTYFCAPNFAYLMVADARAAVGAVPGVGAVEVVLDDHFASGEINATVARDGGFVEAFPEQAEEELDELRLLFQRKAFLARQGRLCDRLLRQGLSHAEIAALRVSELPDGPETAQYLARRAELGLDVSPDAPALVRPNGAEVPASAVRQHLRVARLTRLSTEGNAGLCRSLLRTRYGIEDAEEALT